MLKKFWLFGIAALALSLCVVSASQAASSEKELCAGMRDNFLVLKDWAGELGLAPEEFALIEKAGQSIVDGENERQTKFGIDQNYENISKLLQIHATDIVKSAKEMGETAIEDIGFSYRFVFLSCRACHKIYKTEERMSP